MNKSQTVSIFYSVFGSTDDFNRWLIQLAISLVITTAWLLNSTTVLNTINFLLITELNSDLVITTAWLLNSTIVLNFINFLLITELNSDVTTAMYGFNNSFWLLTTIVVTVRGNCDQDCSGVVPLHLTGRQRELSKASVRSWRSCRFGICGDSPVSAAIALSSDPTS